MELKGIEYLRQKLKQKRKRVLLRYEFYDMKYDVKDLGISTPPRLQNEKSVLGWCEKAVDTLGDRLQFKKFEDDGFGFNEIFQKNNATVLFDSIIHEALIGSCSFVYVSKDGTDTPKLQVFSGASATGVMNPFSSLLDEGYAVLEMDDYGNPTKELYFTPTYTELYENGQLIETFDNPTGVPLLVPVPYKADAVRPFGHSRITRACMDYVISASRTIKRSEISAEFYSFPQKYAVGLSEDAEPLEKWKASMSSMITFTKDEDGQSPHLGQFSQQSMSPHNDQLKMFANLFAGETGLTLQDLGFDSTNPTSADSIKASHENLKLTAIKAQRCFENAFKNIGLVASSLRDGIAYDSGSLMDVKAVWMPIFEPDASMLATIGDGILKLNQALPNFMGKDNIEKLTGIESDS